MTSRIRETFAAWLARALIDRRISRPALAELVQVDPSTVARWLAGETRPRATTVPLLAAGLGFEVMFVYRLAGYPGPSGGAAELLAEEIELLAYFRRLSQAQKRIVLAAARGGSSD